MNLNIHGLTVRCKCDASERAPDILRTFKLFRVDEPGGDSTIDLLIDVQVRAPDYAAYPRLTAAFTTPRNIVYRSQGLTLVDYAGQAVVEEIEAGRRFRLVGTDPDLLRAIAGHVVLSAWGRYCDRKNYLRVHATAVSFGDTAALILMPTGSGKSTLLRSLLDEPGLKIITEDTAVLDREGRILPALLPLGIRDPDVVREVPAEYLWRDKNLGSDEKWRIDLDYWADRLERRSLSRLVFLCGARLLNGAPSIDPMSALSGLSCLFRDGVMGAGVLQGPEFLMKNATTDLLRRLPLYARRFVRAMGLAIRHPFYRFFISRSPEMNRAALVRFLKDRAVE